MSEPRNYCDCGDYCEWCHPEMCGMVEPKAETVEVSIDAWHAFCDAMSRLHRELDRLERAIRR